MQLIINTPDNFDIYSHMSELKAQGFMLLSFIKQEFGEAKKIKFKTKNFAEKLGVHVSTLRRWVKRLISLDFVTPDKRQRDPVPKEQSASVGLKSMTENVMACDDSGKNNDSSQTKTSEKWAPDHSATRSKAPCLPPSGMTAIRDDAPKDPLEHFLDTMDTFTKSALEITMQKKGVEIDASDKPALKQIMLSSPHNMQELMAFYDLFSSYLKE